MVLIRQACQVSDAIRPVDGDQRVTGFGLLASSDTQLLLAGFEPAPLPRTMRSPRTRPHGAVLLDGQHRRQDLFNVPDICDFARLCGEIQRL